MDLTTSYLGLKLPHPLMPGSSPLAEDLDRVKRLEDAGAAAIVIHSLFEEQIALEQHAALRDIDGTSDISAEALSFFPKPQEYRLGPDQYLKHVRRVKEAVSCPVIASLNGVSPSGWLKHARLIEQAGADALELNLYYLATNARETGDAIEKRALQIVREVKGNVHIPVAVKISPFYSSPAHFAALLEQHGADGIVLFNRFYQPDIDPVKQEAVSTLQLSDSNDLRLRLRWLAVFSSQLKLSLAVSGGVHTPVDAVKALMAGADAVQVVSALLLHGPQYLKTLREGLARWMEENEFESVAQMKGSMSLKKCPDASAYERANYMKILASWK